MGKRSSRKKQKEKIKERRQSSTKPAASAKQSQSANSERGNSAINAGISNKDEKKEELTLKEKIKKGHCKDFRMVEGLLIGKLEMRTDDKDTVNKVQKLMLGKPNSLTTKVILLVGATGTGKTTLINAMTNNIFGVDFSDDFRFKLIDEVEDPSRSEALSQTDYITAYSFYNFSGMPFNFNYVLIDTPGFGDTRGIQRDQEMMAQIESFLKQDYGIDQVDGVGFVIPASATRLTQTQQYVLDGLSSIFGKDIKENIFIMATFADARKPPVLKALAELDMEYGAVYRFNNSALFARNKVEKYNPDEGSESDDEDEVSMSKQYWDMASKSMNNFFTKLGQMMPVSLTLTKEVLEERRHLQTVVYSLQHQVRLGLEKLSNLNAERQLLSKLDDEMKGAKDHYIEVDIPKVNEIKLTPHQCVTNCVKCSFTCHFPCYIPKHEDKKHCSAMRHGICKVCPANCEWTVHKHMDFRYETSWTTEVRTAQELLSRYNRACLGKLTKEKIIHSIGEDIKEHSKGLVELIKDIQGHVERLENIALKPNPLSTKQYIDLLVQSEKMQKLHNFEKRVEMLLKLKEEVQILEAATSAAESLPETGEALLMYFQNKMDLEA